MKVKKRNGALVPVRLDSITDRISQFIDDLDKTVIDPVKITFEVVEKLYDGIPTSVIDTFAAEICHSKTIEHPHFNILASRLLIDDHHKNLSIKSELSFSNICTLLYNSTDQLGEHCPLISEELFQFSQQYKEEINSMIDLKRDFLFDYFGFKTLQKGYLLKIENKIVETPQFMFMRVALGIWGSIKTRDGTVFEPDFDAIKKTYDLMSLKYFTHATPTLFNAGLKNNSLFSCFLLGMEDDIKSIFKVVGDAAMISKWAGGIGIHLSNIRGNGSYVRGTNGKSEGIVPLLKVYNDVARYINQGGKRSGSIAMYIEPWHCDILDFLKCKRPHGDMNKRTLDLFFGLWIPDLFMERVQNGEMWSLMCPSECPGLNEVYGPAFKKLYEKYEKEGKICNSIKAKDLFDEIIKSQSETGTPYMLYKDAANQKSNQKNIGTIKSSNLCVAPETRILTRKGYYPIKDLVNQDIEVWNGEEWSKTQVKQTGVNQKLICITMSNGSTVYCTEYHKFILNDETIVEARDLKIGSTLINFKLPIVVGGDEDMPKETCFCMFYKEINVPMNHSLNVKLKWFSDICNTYGLFNNNTLQIINVPKKKLIEIQLMLQTMGIKSSVRHGILIIDSLNLQYLLDLGFSCDLQLNVTKTMNSKNVKVVLIEDTNRWDDTYCFTESKKNRGIFEGVLLGNCAEIIEYSDSKKYACCVLSSIVLPTYVVDGKFDFDKLYEVVKFVTKNLNKLIDINFYSVEETKVSNMSERPIGIGIQGLADVFFKLELPYESEEAIKLDREIMETIYFAALTSSMELSKIDGPYPSFKGSPISKGHFQFDLWNEFQIDKTKKSVVQLSGRWDWDKLRKDIKKHGVRNSLVTALMPTASTSHIMGSASEAFEPITSNCYTRKIKAGEYIVLNKYMAEALIKRGLWTSNTRNMLLEGRGSIQSFDIPQDLKDVYKTVWEIKQKNLINHSLARGPFVDQSQSLNLYFDTTNTDQIIGAHFYGWINGLKTGSYYIRTKPAINAASFTKEQQEEEEEEQQVEEEPCVMCSS